MKIKLFSSFVGGPAMQDDIDEWTDEVNPTIISVTLNAIPLHDNYSADHSMTPGGICNQWIEYTTAIVYEL